LARAVVNEQLAAESTLFEGKVAAEVIARLPAGAVLHVGNSMPVRDLDTFGAAGGRTLRVDGNRGANGIDGVLSSALGAAAVSDRPTVLVVGDLSFLHDLGGLQIAARHALDAVVVVVNNDGGGVFSFLPCADYGEVFERCFATPHGLDLAAAATLGGARHHRIADWSTFGAAFTTALATPGLDVIEVPTDRDENARRHRVYAEAVHVRLRAERRSDAA
jgi:2-succinyl-5-enolpyruvyl-6-hydroxy-3-cyclohexene-1-carboxylate synthase